MIGHQWQQFTECCVRCGFNAYDKSCLKVCPGDDNSATTLTSK